MTELTVALLLSLLTAPLLLGIAVVSTLVYRSSPLFVHERVGRHGRQFSFLKVRTLPPTTGRYLDKHALSTAPIPGVMRAVRRMHLDEIPQLWLVLTGHLSLVGPRAEMAILHERIAPAAAAERLAVRPGVTGLWQVSVHCDGLICDRIEYDRLYVRHRCLRLDAWILWCTAQKVLRGRRIHLYDVPRWAIVEPVLPVPTAIAAASDFIDLTGDAPTVAGPESAPAIAV